MIDWEHIETAPRDGTPLLLWLPAPLSKPAIGRWNQTLFAGLLRTAIWRGAMNISHRTGRLSRRRAVPRSCLPEGYLPGRVASSPVGRTFPRCPTGQRKGVGMSTKRTRQDQLVSTRRVVVGMMARDKHAGLYPLLSDTIASVSPPGSGLRSGCFRCCIGKGFDSPCKPHRYGRSSETDRAVR